jgi:hypothetical protein
MKREIEILSVTYKTGDKEYSAVRASAEEIKAAGLSDGCTVGDEKCIGGLILRCLCASGRCWWYRTNEPC